MDFLVSLFMRPLSKNNVHALKRTWEILLSLRRTDTFNSLKKCDVLFICHDLDRGETWEGKAYSKLLDSLDSEFKYKGLKTQHLSHPYSRITGESSWSNPALCNRIFFWAAIKRRLKKFLIYIRLNKLNYDYQQEVYITILKKITPKCIITIGSPPYLCRAANALNINICEILHGIGYTPIPWGWDLTPAENLPNIIWSLDEVSTNTFKPLSSKGIVTRQIPHPFYKLFNNAQHNFKDKLPNEWLELPKIYPSGSKKILISLQWGYDGDHIKNSHFDGILPNGLFPAEILKLIEILGKDYFWCFRLHPEQLRSSRYKYQKKILKNITEQYKNCEWELSSTLPLPLLLSHCSGHITMSSMSTYDAAFMSVKTLLLCPTLSKGRKNQNMFEDLLISGYASKCLINQTSILEWVQQVMPSDAPFSTKSAESWDDCMGELFDK